jgi:hypothetical protein
LALGVKRAGPVDALGEGAQLADLMRVALQAAFREGAGADHLIAAAAAALASPEQTAARPASVAMTDWRLGHIAPPALYVPGAPA